MTIRSRASITINKIHFQVLDFFFLTTTTVDPDDPPAGRDPVVVEPMLQYILCIFFYINSLFVFFILHTLRTVILSGLGIWDSVYGLTSQYTELAGKSPREIPPLSSIAVKPNRVF